MYGLTKEQMLDVYYKISKENELEAIKNVLAFRCEFVNSGYTFDEFINNISLEDIWASYDFDEKDELWEAQDKIINELLDAYFNEHSI